MQQLAPRSSKTHSLPIAPPIEIVVRLTDGGRFTVTAPTGSRVIDAIRHYGLPLRAECEGRCMCASCHVRVDARWANRLEAPNVDELAVLNDLSGADFQSRLICQLILLPDLDGLEIELDPASLVPQTYWAAG